MEGGLKGGRTERAGGWSPPVLAEGARSEGAPSMRAVGGAPTTARENGELPINKK